MKVVFQYNHRINKKKLLSSTAMLDKRGIEGRDIIMSQPQGPHIPALEMQAQPKQQLTQRLIMSQYMQQAINLLQIPLIELSSFIEEQVMTNPILESVEDDRDHVIDGEDYPQHVLEEIDQVNSENEQDDKEIVINEQDFAILRQLDEDFYDYVNESQFLYSQKNRDDEKLKTYLESSICAEPKLYEQLTQQARQSFENPEDLHAATILIGYIDEQGLLKTALTEIALFHGLSETQLLKVLKEIQTFEPYGVGAASIQASLLIQLTCLHKENTLAYRILAHCYEHLLYNRIPLIAKKLGCSIQQVQEAIEKDILKLNLHPGAQLSQQQAQFLLPDVTLRQEGDELIVEVNREHAPGLRLNHHYLKMLEDPEVPTATKSFIKHHIFSAKWLARNLQQRYSTIERIAASLAKRQYDFFTNPSGKLMPLTMKALAEELNVHESTIARTVANKYLNSPRGLIPLRAFFTHGYLSEEGQDLSAQTVREAIIDIIEKEDKKKPFSDEEISALLKERGISCARRTVAKYRCMLKIGNKLQRRRF